MGAAARETGPSSFLPSEAENVPLLGGPRAEASMGAVSWEGGAGTGGAFATAAGVAVSGGAGGASAAGGTEEIESERAPLIGGGVSKGGGSGPSA